MVLGDSEAAEEFFMVLSGLHYPRIRRTIHDSNEALDILQETLLATWENALNGKFEDPEISVVTYTFGIANRKIWDYWGARKRRIGAVNDHPAEIPSVHGVAQSRRWRQRVHREQADRADRRPSAITQRKMDYFLLGAALNQAFDMLEFRERECLEKNFLEGISLEEISHGWGNNRSWAPVVKETALRKIRNFFHREYPQFYALGFEAASEGSQSGLTVTESNRWSVPDLETVGP